MIGLIDLNRIEFNYDYKGYTSIINQVVDIAIEHYKKYNDYSLIITDSQIEMHYENIFNGGRIDYDASLIFLEDFYQNKTEHNIFNAHTIANVDNLKRRYVAFNNILKIKPEIKELVDDIISKLDVGVNTLAIQIRGTDKKTEIPEIPIDVIIDKIKKFKSEYMIDNIFVSTDEFKYIEVLVNTFGDMIKYNDNNLFSYDGNPIHNTINRDKVNIDVLLDSYVLANCGYFLYSFSNVSFLALTIGNVNFKKIKNLNYED